jgi:hypothetical protein
MTNQGEISTESIALSELLSKFREALSSLMKPDLSSVLVNARGRLPVPDVDIFAVHPGKFCIGNDKAIYLDISETSGALEITICTFLGFEIEGELDSSGLLDEIEDSIKLSLEADYVLQGALSTGIKITASLDAAPLLEMDPIVAQLYASSKLNGAVDLGLIETSITGNALIQGRLELAWCSSCDGVYTSSDVDYTRAGNTSFYYNRAIGYQLGGGLALSAGGRIPGVEIGVGVELSIQDDDAFDDIPPVVRLLPDAQALLDSMKFSPQNAVDMLRLVDAMLAQATANKSFDVYVPLLDTSISKIISFGSVFTDTLFEYFVIAERFEDRAVKSLSIKG